MGDRFRIDRRDDGTAVVMMTRPEVSNAFDDVLIRDLAAALRALGEDDAVRAVVLAGEGRSFCAGADLAWMARAADYSEEDNLADATNLTLLLYTLDQLPKPTVARVQGAVYGGGVGLVACCDVAVASEDARFCLSEVKLGVVPAVISPYVVAALGRRNSRRLFQTAEVIDARRACEVGLVQEVVEASSLDGRVDEILRLLAAGAPGAKATAKRLVNDVADRPLGPDLLNETARLIARVRTGPEAREGFAAFLERRRPTWA